MCDNRVYVCCIFFLSSLSQFNRFPFFFIPVSFLRSKCVETVPFSLYVCAWPTPLHSLFLIIYIYGIVFLIFSFWKSLEVLYKPYAYGHNTYSTYRELPVWMENRCAWELPLLTTLSIIITRLCNFTCVLVCHCKCKCDCVRSFFAFGWPSVDDHCWPSTYTLYHVTQQPDIHTVCIAQSLAAGQN